MLFDLSSENMQVSRRRMNNISFTSHIKLITQDEFDKKIEHLNPKKHRVDYPWTPDTGKTGKNLYTTGIQDCIAIGLIDNKKSKLFHICTRSRRDGINSRQKGFDIKNIERRILDNTNMENQDLHGFIFGGWYSENNKYNTKQLQKIKNIFDKNLIPYTIIAGNKDSTRYCPTSVFYSTKEDTFYITDITLGKYSKMTEDSLSYYRKDNLKEGEFFWDRPQVRTSKEEYLKSKYKEVSLCKFDTFA